MQNKKFKTRRLFQIYYVGIMPNGRRFHISAGREGGLRYCHPRYRTEGRILHIRFDSYQPAWAGFDPDRNRFTVQTNSFASKYPGYKRNSRFMRDMDARIYGYASDVVIKKYIW